MDIRVVEFLHRLKPVVYSNQRFDEAQQLAAILSDIRRERKKAKFQVGIEPGTFELAERLIKKTC